MNKKFGVDYYSQQHIKEYLHLIKSTDFWNSFNTPIEIFTFFKDKISILHIYKYIKKYRPDFKLNSNVSIPHKIINDFLDTLNVKYVVNTRKIISPLELDIFIPEHKLDIEINGVYYHTEEKGKDKNYHLNKVNKCEEKDIELIHLSDIDILTKQDIVFNLIKDKLNLNKDINSKDCTIIDLDKETIIDFMKDNSLNEYNKSGIHRGLVYNDEIISIISLKELNTQIEIINYTTKLGYNIKNGLQKLLKEIKGDFIINVDRRFSNGKFYLDNKFKLTNISNPEYYFTKDYSTFFYSLNFDKSILNDYNSKLSVYDNIIQNKYNLIWDCGYKTYSFSNY